jgi:two-component system sensor histidine kinase DesK
MRLLPKDQDWTAYAWLIYLLYFVALPFIAHRPSGECALAVAGGIAGCGLYFWSYWIRGPRVLWIVAGWFLMAAALVKMNPAASVFFVYGASTYGRFFEPPAGFRFLAAHVAAVALACWALNVDPYTWASSLVFSALIGAIVIHYSHRKRLNVSLLAARAEVEHLAKVAERERIGRDLHDLLGHTLSVIILKSELASRLASTQPERAAEEIRDVERISRDALAQVRAAVRGYRATGFESELVQARQMLETAGIRVESSLEHPRLPAVQESVFALALREAVTNVVRHAHATCCRLTVRRSDEWCELEVADDGTGGALQEGNGLSGMRQRVEALGGVLECDGSRGTLLRVRVPV